MAIKSPSKPRVFVDADVLFTGAASPVEHSASLVILRMAEITLIEAATSQQVVEEVERNLEIKIPLALPSLRLIVSRSLKVVPAPSPVDLLPYVGMADPKDLPILVAAVQAGCSWLVTYNIRLFQPGHPQVVVFKPGDFVMRIRELLVKL
jgi:hypothetical protein